MLYEVITEALLFGAGFSPTEVKEQLSILVLSVQSFSANNKDSRKAYQENENLQQFPATYQHTHKLLPDVDETALMQVINQLHPVIIIDESHNFEADLRIEMLNNINPSFILDLTATPKERSNIISFVDAIHLKNNNMVKLPVIVLNHQDTNEVRITSYNVCYTKLLRIDNSKVGIDQMISNSEREGLKLTGLVGDVYAFDNYQDFDIVLLDSMFHFEKRESYNFV